MATLFRRPSQPPWEASPRPRQRRRWTCSVRRKTHSPPWSRRLGLPLLWRQTPLRPLTWAMLLPCTGTSRKTPCWPSRRWWVLRRAAQTPRLSSHLQSMEGVLPFCSQAGNLFLRRSSVSASRRRHEIEEMAINLVPPRRRQERTGPGPTLEGRRKRPDFSSPLLPPST